jgi:chemotaxis protein MotB
MAEGNDNPAPIIIIRKKAGHGGHHGGAWKVAYADFVTAMMALFIVLWLLNTSDQVKKAIGGYFQDPKGYGKQTGTTVMGTGEALSLSQIDMKQIKEKLEEAIKRAPEFKTLKDHIQMTVTGEGLRIELLETQRGMFFESGNAKPSEFGNDLLERLAAELGKLPNKILVEGHTDAKPFSSERGYSNWELSSDRANSARRIMQETGLRADQVTQVRGYADQRLRNPKDPNDPSNRRISLIVQYMPGDIAATESPKPKPGEAAKPDEKKAKH